MSRAISNRLVRTCAVVGALLFACLLAGVGPAAAAPLSQAGTATLTGRVLSLDNVALPNVRLAAYAQAPSVPNRTPLSRFQSDAQGSFSVTVPAGQIWLEFETQDINGQSFWGYSNLPVNVAAGETVGGQDFRVAIRIVSEPSSPPPAPAPLPPAPAPAPAPGMPSTGDASNSLLPVAAGFGLLLVVFGTALRRRVAR